MTEIVTDFNGEAFELQFRNKNMYEFVPAGQTVESWQKMLTFIGPTVGIDSYEKLDQQSQAIYNQYKQGGADIFDAKTVAVSQGLARMNENIVVAVFPPDAGGFAEVVMARIRLNVGSTSSSVLVYSERVSKDELENYIETKLKTDELQNLVINMNFPSFELLETFKDSAAI